MLQKQQIIISYYRQGYSQRRIAKTLGMNRKTVKKYLKEYEGEKAQSSLDHLGLIHTPQYDGSRRMRRSLTEDLQTIIDSYLAKNVEKRSIVMPRGA
ncbi:MAG: helix-turn-helix domain-containing protein [Saprospiraceae bacterium]